MFASASASASPPPARRGPVLEPRTLPSAVRPRTEERERIARAVRDGALTRIRRGVYVRSPAADDEEWRRREHALLAAMRGVAERLTTRWWFSHTSAAMLWGCWVDPLPHDVHTMQLYPPKIRESDATHRRHWTKLPLLDPHEIDGIPVTGLERTMVDCARLLREQHALPVLDSGLRLGADPRRLEQLLEAARGQRGVKRARRVIELADARSESPRESMTRWIIHEGGLPTPELAIRVLTPQGGYWVDIGWEALKVGVEFDGAVKYSGEYGDPRAVLIAEKRRHDALAEAGWDLVRVMAPDHAHPSGLLRRLDTALARARRRG